MVTTEGDHTGQSLALLRRANLVRVGGRVAGKDTVVALLDLVKSPGVVVPLRQPKHASVHTSFDQKVRTASFPSRNMANTYEVTGMSPQSNTVAQLLKGFVSRGTL